MNILKHVGIWLNMNFSYTLEIFNKMLFFKIFELFVNWCYVYVLMLYVIYFDAVETETEKYIYLGQNTFIFSTGF